MDIPEYKNTDKKEEKNNENENNNENDLIEHNIIYEKLIEENTNLKNKIENAKINS